MIDLYYWPTPNGHKVTLLLEEAGLEYRIHPVNIGSGDQFKPEFRPSRRTTRCRPSSTMPRPMAVLP